VEKSHSDPDFRHGVRLVLSLLIFQVEEPLAEGVKGHLDASRVVEQVAHLVESIFTGGSAAVDLVGNLEFFQLLKEVVADELLAADHSEDGLSYLLDRRSHFLDPVLDQLVGRLLLR